MVKVVSRESTASAQTPATSNSSVADEYATPLTSYGVTPLEVKQNPFDAVNLDGVKRTTSKIEVVIPSFVPTARPAALQNNIFSRGSKRKRAVIDDSDDDYESDNSPDAQLARRLQAEEDALAFEPPETIASSSRTVYRRGTRVSPPAARADSDEDLEDDDSDDDKPLPAVSRKGKEKALPLTKPARSKPRKPRPDTEEEMEAKIAEIMARPLALTKAGKPRVDALRQRSAEIDFIRNPPYVPASFYATESELSDPPELLSDEESFHSGLSDFDESDTDDDEDDEAPLADAGAVRTAARTRRAFRAPRNKKRAVRDRDRLELHHPELKTMWKELEDMPVLKAGKADQPKTISRALKPFQLEGLAWMKAMENTTWKGGLLGDEMGLGKTIQAVSLIMSDWPAKDPTLVLVPPVALHQWTSEIKSYTDGCLNTLIFHGTNAKAKNLTVKEVKKYHVIIMSYNSLESMYRKQEKGFKRKEGLYKEQSIIHSTKFHRVILDEAHSIKTRSTMTAKACFALKVDYRWCLSGTPLQNRIGEFFSLIRFLNVQPFASYLCKHCPCKKLEWDMDDDNRCKVCKHGGMQHVSVFNQELLNPIQKYGNMGPGAEAFKKLRIMTDRIMLRRLKKDHTDSMELPVKEIFVDRQFFGEEENDFANSIMTSGQRKFDTYVAQGVLLNNYANIFGLIMQMRQVADHPDLILKKNSAGGQNVLVCCICDEPAEEAIRSRCKHDFCRQCAKSYLLSSEQPDCPQCHIALSIDLEQPEIEQDEDQVKKSSIINRIKMENWTSSSKIELLVHELHRLRSDNASHKSIIFSQFTTMLQLIEWRLRRAGITTVMLDGSMTPAQRQASIEHFMNNVNVECFLVSLKAGGVALNLTEASRVFIVDP
jgi:DNA repair protein RAD16